MFQVKYNRAEVSHHFMVRHENLEFLLTKTVASHITNK